MREMITGYQPGTDEVETTEDHTTRVLWTRITRRLDNGAKLRIVLPHRAIIDPWREEFLWRPMKALGVVDVWWSMHREHPEAQAAWSVYETADGYQSSLLISLQLIGDPVAWKACQTMQFEKFLIGYQRSLDAKTDDAGEVTGP